MSRALLTGNATAAWAARLAAVDYVPAFPITPQTEIIETLARWIHAGEMRARIVTMDSEHSMLTAAGAAAATGVRVFTATSSQGLLFGFEMLYAIAGLRLPLVLVNVSRGPAHPLTLEPDHSDVLSARDAGFLQFHAESCQEVLDSILIAYRLAEHERVLLPAIVNLDGFYLSYTREAVDLPAPEEAGAFLPAFAPAYPALCDPGSVAFGAAVLDSSLYTYFKHQMHLAAEAALQLYPEIAAEFASRFGRSHAAVEPFMLDDADYAIVMTNSFAAMGKAEVRRLRSEGKKVGLVRLRMLRPFPHAELRRLLAGRKGVAVVDQNISVGKGGVLFSEISSALYGLADRPPVLLSFIGGLGGRRFRPGEFDAMLERLENPPADTARACWLFTEEEAREIERLLAIAGGATT
ncbi:MAG TPA: pyruvate synthase [candidate division Zixibacteria bacterium]|nr:pyruvate synthase [candidate division Zixibacteria bacterium]